MFLTRRIKVYLTLYKAPYHMALGLYTLNLLNYLPVMPTTYTSYMGAHASKKLWKYYSTIIQPKQGLISTNQHTSSIGQTLAVSNRMSLLGINNIVPQDLTTFSVYHFHTNKDLMKQLIIKSMIVLPTIDLYFMSNYCVYTSYIWLSNTNWVNSYNNVFYLKIYNY